MALDDMTFLTMTVAVTANEVHHAASQRGPERVMPETMELSFDEMAASAARASTLLKSMSNENRLLILCQLVEGEKSVTELQSRVALSQSALSQHLAVLRRDNLVKTKRVAQSIYYSLASREVRAVLATLYKVFCTPK